MSLNRLINNRRLLGALACLFLVSCGGSGGGGDPRPGGFKEDGGRAVDRPPGATAAVTIAPPDTGDGWAVSTPDAQDIDAASLKASLDRWLAFGTGGLDAVVVVRNDQLVAEGYFNGYDRNTLHDVRSVTKSITSALTGIAAGRGIIGLEDTIAQHIPNFESYPGIDDGKRSIRIRHLVNMQTGMDCDDGSDFSPGNESRMYDKDDWVRFALGIPMAVAPGERMSYCSAGVMLLGHILATRAGVKLEDFAAANLFGPLGIQQVR
jgi:CubicO group peptidase (beta-lactamase class C family)